MRRNPILLGAGLLAVAGLVQACTPAGGCNARQAGNVLEAAGCIQSGGFEAHNQRIRDDTQQKIAQTQLTQAETAQLNAQAATLARDRRALEAKLDQMAAELAGLQLDLQSVVTDNRETQARVDQMEQELRQAQAELNAAQSDSGSLTEAEIAQLTQEVERKQKAVREILDSLSTVE